MNIRVIPRASRNRIEKEEDRLKVYVTKPADSGQANKAVIDLLADYFDVAKSRIKIIKGASSHNKIVEITDV